MSRTFAAACLAFLLAACGGSDKLKPEYALLGKVTEGREIADKIGAIITDPRSDFPDDPVVIKSIKVAER